MAYSDLVAGGTIEGTYFPSSLFVAEQDYESGASVSLDASIAQYTVCALTNTGVTRFIAGTHTKDQMVINVQPVTAIGEAVPYWRAAKILRHDALVWPAGATLDTLAERKAFVQGTGFAVGALQNNGNPPWQPAA